MRYAIERRKKFTAFCVPGQKKDLKFTEQHLRENQVRIAQRCSDKLLLGHRAPVKRRIATECRSS